MRAFLVVLAFLGIGAAVTQLPSFNRTTDDGKAIVVGDRGVSWKHGVNGVVSVLDHGADASGVADSLPAFKSALAFATGNACQSGGAACSDYATGPTGWYGIKACDADNDCNANTYCDIAAGLCGTVSLPVHVPRGRYKLSDTLHLRTKVELYGDGQLTSVIRTPAGKGGIVVNYVDTAPTSDGYAGGSIIKHLGLEPYAVVATRANSTAYALGAIVVQTTNPANGLVFQATTAGTSAGSPPTYPTTVGGTVADGSVTWTARWAAGIWLRAAAEIEDVKIGSVITASQGFAGHGLQIVANTAGSPPDNANGWVAKRLIVSSNRGDGVYAQGADANRGVLDNGTLDDNGGWGINDASFLGNTWRNLISQSNGNGGYKCTGDVAVSQFYDCYSESDEPASVVEFPAAVIGGLFAGAGGVGANGFSGSNASKYINGVFHGVTYAFNGNSTNGYVQTVIGNDGTDPDIANTWRGYNASKVLLSGTELRLKYWHAGGVYRWDLSNSDFLLGALVATSQQASYPEGIWVFPNGLAVNNGGDHWSTGVVMTANSTRPTTCRAVGDIVYNKSATGPPYWRCTSTSPAIWQTIIGGKSTTLAATGTVQGDAAVITNVYDTWRVTGGNTFVGVILPTGPTGECKRVFNDGGTLKVYPNTGDTIDGGSADVHVSQTANVGVTYCLHNDATNWERN
jgi:hypothetical protein